MNRAAALYFLAATGGPLLAQEAAQPDELTALRAGFIESIAAGDRAVYKNFADRLGSEEKAWADAGDYATAARLRALRESSLSISGTSDGRQSFQMEVTTARNKGSGLGSQEGAQIKFTSPAAFLEWELNGEFKGWYEVMLTHGVDGRGDHTAEINPVSGPLPQDRKQKHSSDDYSTPKSGGWVGFEKISNLDRGVNTLHREIVSTGGWNTLRRVSLGRMELSGNTLRCRLTAKDALAEGLMNFKTLEIIPSTAPSATGAEGESKLDDSRKLFENLFNTSTADLNKTYLLALKRMEAQQKDPDVLARIKREIERLQTPSKLAFSNDDDSGLREAIVLPSGSGIAWKLSGDVRFEGTKKIFTSLKPAGTGAIAWRLATFNVPSGTYSVGIKGRAPINGGGTATLAAAGAGTIAGKPLAIKVDPVISPANRAKKPEIGSSPPQPERRDIDAGSIVVPKGAEYLTLTVQSLTHLDGSLLDITSITLSRTGDVPVPKNP